MKRLLAALLILASASAASAQESAAFLKTGVGARPLGMGGAFTAIADDINALTWNPGGLGTLKARELGFMHSDMAGQSRYEFLGFAQPLKVGTLGMAGRYLTEGTLDGRDENGKPSGGFSAVDEAVDLAYGARLSPNLGAGGAVRYVRSSIADASAATYAVDFGGIYTAQRTGPGVPTIGVAVQNVGPGLQFLDQRSPLPLTVALGLGYRLPAGLTLATDFKRRPNEQSSEIDLGTEYRLLPAFALRAGYGATAGPQRATGAVNVRGLTGGFGIKALGYSVDYSITPFGDIGYTHRLSLGVRFSGTGR